TAQQPDNNVVRVALQALAAVLGGCQSLHTNSKDEALALPSETTARVALRTQQVIAWESGVADTVDPLGGAYAVEAATDAVEAEALRLLDEIEAGGGALKAIERGDIQRQIQESAYRHQTEVEAGQRAIVGVNLFAEEVEAVFRLRPEEAIALLFLLPTTYLTVVASVYARKVGALGDRHPGGLARLAVAVVFLAYLFAARRLWPRAAWVRGLREVLPFL